MTLPLVWETPSGDKFFGTQSPIVVKKCLLKDRPHACFNCVEKRLK